jgi:ATP-dependent protease HslVU (ClpYQ) peptidase subunit
MTTVAFDGQFLAADGRATLGNLISAKSTQKIFPLVTRANGVEVKAVLAGAGSYESILLLKKHLEGNDLHDCEMIPEFEPGEMSGLLILETGEAFVLEHRLVPMPTESPVAIGSGTDFAMAAMSLGKSATEAVKVACELDCFSGGRIKTFDIESWGFV